MFVNDKQMLSEGLSLSSLSEEGVRTILDEGEQVVTAKATVQYPDRPDEPDSSTSTFSRLVDAFTPLVL